MPQGVQLSIGQTPIPNEGKEVQPSPNKVNRDLVMVNEEIKDITLAKISDREITGNVEIKEKTDFISLSNLSPFGYEPNFTNGKYTDAFSRREKDVTLNCNVKNLNLESIQISDTSQDLPVLGSKKRKVLADISDEDLFSANKRRRVQEKGNKIWFKKIDSD
ncbi:hypothetical protein V6N13_038702 [Hibiscus sabdariffa]